MLSSGGLQSLTSASLSAWNLPRGLRHWHWPYGPLSLTVWKSTGNAEADVLRNYYLGTMGHFAGVDPKGMPDQFHCGPPCAMERMRKARANLAVLRTIVQEFKALPHQAQKPAPGEKTVDGLRYVALEDIEPDVVFYETT